MGKGAEIFLSGVFDAILNKREYAFEDLYRAKYGVYPSYELNKQFKAIVEEMPRPSDDTSYESSYVSEDTSYSYQ